jgi:hypothetical protein
VEAVLEQLGLRRDPTFTLYLWGLWTKAPALLWLVVIVTEIYALYLAQGV